MEQRLQKILAAAGVASRRHCEELIVSGRVAVNGHVVKQLGSKADPGKDVITLDGRPVSIAVEKVYILLNKPVGYTVTRADPHARRTVLDLLRGVDTYVYPVGRLDVDTSGLLILTNDGEFAHALTHPSHRVQRVYRAVVRGRPTASDLELLRQGIELEDGLTSPAGARLIRCSDGTNESIVEITINEGRKRQVRRMLAAIGCRVRTLVRTRFGTLDLKGLKEGEFRFLTAREVSHMKRLALRRTPPGGAGGRRKR